MINSIRFEEIVREAGRMAHDQWPGAGHEVEMWEKEPGHPVCAADLAVDAFLKRELGALLPAAGWLSEETADDPQRLGRDLIWLVDPIDGTRDFINGRDGWAVSVALISGGRPLIGMLAAPARGEEWLSLAGQGATRNGEVLRSSKRTEYTGSRIPIDGLGDNENNLIAVEKPNSIALRIAKIAADEADLIATMRWGYEWDIGAATLIAREAGAEVSDTLGNPLAYNKRDPRAFGVLVSAPAIHPTAVERLADRAQKIAKAG